MGRAKPITLGGTEFATKGAAMLALKRILNEYKQRPREKIDQRHEGLLYGAISKHPQFLEKVGAGIEYFYVDRAIGQSTYCFHVMREDGSWADWSYGECLKPSTPATKFRAACREVVRIQKWAFRDAARNAGEWPLCNDGEPLPLDSVDVHHAETSFEEIVESFIDVDRVCLEAVKFRESGDRQTCTEFEDQELAKRFGEFHHARAKLQVLPREQHRRLKRSEEADSEKREPSQAQMTFDFS